MTKWLTVLPLLEVAHAPQPVTIRRPVEEGLGGLTIYEAIAAVVVLLVLGTLIFQILRVLFDRQAKRSGK